MVITNRTGLTIDDVKQALKSEEKISRILESILGLHSKLDKQHLMLTKLAIMISKMYQDGDINKDTFNRLDEFLHDWLDSEFKENKKQ